VDSASLQTEKMAKEHLENRAAERWKAVFRNMEAAAAQLEKKTSDLWPSTGRNVA